MPRVVNVARPAASVWAVSPAMDEPAGPVTTLAAIFTPAWIASLPNASRNCTAGWTASAAPFTAVAPGWVTRASCVAGPAASIVAAAAVADVSPVATNRRV